MAYSLKITDEALTDIDEITEWYFAQKPNQQERCNQKILNCLEEIEKHPTHYGFFAEEYRQATVETFPYKIAFKISDTYIDVFAIFHLHRSDEAIMRLA
jgi:plasmid stabilization system protein ParE